MRVPSIGMTLEDRRHLREIVAEGYALAERLLANYADPAPGPVATMGHWLAQRWQALRGFFRATVRN